MENLFVWIVLFAGAAIVLLGVFLAASERELKKKRREIAELSDRLEMFPGASSTDFSSAQPVNGAEVTGLRAKNQELQKELASTAYDLDESRSLIEALQAAQKQPGSDRPEAHELRNANEQLRAEVDVLRSRLQASEAKASESAAQNQGSVNRESQLEDAIIGLKQQLEMSQAKIRELENSQTQTISLTAVEAPNPDEIQKLEAKIAELEKETASSSQKLRDLETLRLRAAESERVQQELREENQRRAEEMPRLQARLAEGEESRKRLAALKSPYQELLGKQTSLAERQSSFQEELAAFASLIATPHPTDNGAHHPSESTNNGVILLSTPATDTHHQSQPEARPDPLVSAAPEPFVIAVQSENKKPKRRFGILRPLIALVAVGALGAGLWNSGSDQPVTHAAKPKAEATAKPEQKRIPITIDTTDVISTPSESPAAPAPVVRAREQIAKDQAEPAKPTKPAKTEIVQAATYEITQATRVFAAPTEFAQHIGDIEPGLKVSVVNARDGWLEIHSKHGRPPGFIRREAAAKVGG